MCLRFLFLAAVAPLLAVLDFVAPAACGADKDEAATSGAKTLDEQLAAYQRLSSVFEAIEPTSVKGKRWVAVDSGPAGWERTVEGWLMEDRPEAVRIWNGYGEGQRLRKPRPGEQQPEAKEGQGLTPDESNSEKYQAAWHVRSGDFVALCKERLKKGVPDKEELPEGVEVFDQGRGHLTSIAIEASRYAHWAAQIGEKRLALDLYAMAATAHKKYTDTYIDSSPELPVFVANKIASACCSGAVQDAHRGAPRADCLRQWEGIVRIPYHDHLDEARRMVAGYKALIAEDAAWKEPAADTLDKMSNEQKTNYWMYRLRDADVEQTSSPGRCNVLGDWHGLLPYQRDPKKPNPAAELKELGVAALPQIIAHLDDTRPTRCKGFWRWYWPDSYYLLCYGDCCQQIFESTSGHSIFDRRYSNGYPIKDGKGKECRAEAERWWREYQRKGEKQMLIEGVEAGDDDSNEQARRLVARYPEAALEPIVKSAHKHKKATLLDIAGNIKDDRVLPFMIEELQSPDQDMRIAAARR